MTNVDKFIRLVTKSGEEIKRRFGVKRLGIFGSCARGEEKMTSDVDVLVSFEEKSFDNYMGLKCFLEDNLGHNVDLVIEDALKPALKEIILSEVRYAA